MKVKWFILSIIVNECSQQTRNVDSRLIYVDITSRRRSRWYPRWFNVIYQRWFLDQIQCWNNVDFGLILKHNFVFISWNLKNQNFYINVEKIAVFERRNNVSLSTLNQRRSLTLKQCWFWVDCKTQFCSYIKKVEN